MSNTLTGVSNTDGGVSNTDVGVSNTDVGVSNTDLGVSSTDVSVSKTDVGGFGQRLLEGRGGPLEHRKLMGMCLNHTCVSDTGAGVSNTGGGLSTTDVIVSKTDVGGFGQRLLEGRGGLLEHRHWHRHAFHLYEEVDLDQ